jgi:hypothetical protein
MRIVVCTPLKHIPPQKVLQGSWYLRTLSSGVLMPCQNCICFDMQNDMTLGHMPVNVVDSSIEAQAKAWSQVFLARPGAANKFPGWTT